MALEITNFYIMSDESLVNEFILDSTEMELQEISCFFVEREHKFERIKMVSMYEHFYYKKFCIS